MTALHMIVQITRADFLERIRRYATLVTLGLAVILTYLILPPADANYMSFNIGHLRGVYNSAWVSGVVTVFLVIIFWVPAFLLVQGAIDHDRKTRVGQIIATTPLTKQQYTLGKMLSNFVYLAALTGAIYLIAMGIQLLLGEEMHIDVWDYLGPYLLIVLPLMALASAVAVLADSLSWLFNGRGSLIVFLGWALLWASLGGTLAEDMPYLYDGSEPPEEAPISLSGVPLIFYSMYRDGIRQNAEQHYGMYIATLPGGLDVNIAEAAEGSPQVGEENQAGFMQYTFTWEGIQWTLAPILGVFIWLPVAVGISCLAGLGFDRFDPARQVIKEHERKSSVPLTEEDLNTAPLITIKTHPLTPLHPYRETNRLTAFWRRLRSEIYLSLKGLRWWWYVIFGGLYLAVLLTPYDLSRGMFLPLAWLWPLMLWSPMGSRENQTNTRGMILSTAYPLRRQLMASWAVGVLIAMIAGSGMAFRYIWVSQWQNLFAWGVGALFIPSLALALGTWSGTSKTFEAVYLVLWYLGPWSKIFYLDFMGVTGEAIAAGLPLYYLVATILLLAGGVLARKRQLH